MNTSRFQSDPFCYSFALLLAQWRLALLVRAFSASLVLLQSGLGRAAITAEQAEFFESKIRPVLATECFECHGAEKKKGGLRVDSREDLLKGGDTGPAIVPGNAEKSLLIRAIAHQDPDLAMPQKRPKLDARIINDFIVWVSMGAPQPEIARTNALPSWADTLASRKEWWSFQPIKKPPLPSLKGRASPDHPVDRFIFAKLEQQGLEPTTPADKRTLIRRITFALTGLPPTPPEIAAFLKDESSEAYPKLVDRLLASPRFGERWARHWMDLVRFAETHGSEGDPEIPQAWRYRDYLIRAFNADIPCDRLIREHIAGDLLPDPRWNIEDGINESIAGVAQLRFVEHGFQPVDPLDDQVRVIENQIDVIGKAFQGLTLACARCHDHKFDPVSQRDFYALAGILASCRPSQVTIDSPETLRRGREELHDLKSQIKEELARIWRAAAADLPTQLPGNSSAPSAPADEMNERIAGLEKELVNLGRISTQRAFRQQITNAALPMPIAAWTFDQTANDLLGEMNAELLGGAEIRKGRLILNGKGAFARTTPLPVTIREKTLEVWLTLASRDQRGGGAITLEKNDGSVFDSVVFGERDPGQWMAGSDSFRRSRSGHGAPETANARELVHMVIAYGADNSVAIYRNGKPYIAPYAPDGDDHTKLQTFEAGGAHLLFGMRHTGGGDPFFAGEIEEARLYNRALTSGEVAASFKAGIFVAPAGDLNLAVQQREQQAKLNHELDRLRTEFKTRFPNFARERAMRERWRAALAAAKEPSHPLYVWAMLRDKAGTNFATGWQIASRQVEEQFASNQKFNTENFKSPLEPVENWFRHGINPPEYSTRPGDFCVEPAGDRVLASLYPVGVYSHLISQKHNGVLTSPRFKVETDSISVCALGGGGGRVRLIVENYPLGAEGIYPQADLKSDTLGWTRLDTAYRKGASAYLEFDGAEEVLSRNRSASGPGGRSWFGVERVAFHDGKMPPKDEVLPSTLLFRSKPPKSAQELASLYTAVLDSAVTAWREGNLNEEQRAFLDFFVRNDLIPNSTNASPRLASLLARYRKLEAEIPAPRRVPGVLETVGYDAPLLDRGDHARPKELVPRRYLEALGSQPYHSKLSGRLELAEEIASPRNPLTARVMVNRIWQQLFGRGLVATGDNFGRLGETPSHPELLDYLAVRFIENGWSIKEMIRFLTTSRAYQMSSESSARSRQIDPANQLLSHMPVRRLEAEAIRDSILAISGRLDETMFGPGGNALAPPAEQRRRSVYLTIRRNSLSPFLQTFDAPKPFTTLGRRETTNVPAQSLALLNDPFVIEMAQYFAGSLASDSHDADARVREMFERALGRLPSDDELTASRAYLGDGDGDWPALAQSLFNLKEFIYVR